MYKCSYKCSLKNRDSDDPKKKIEYSRLEYSMLTKHSKSNILNFKTKLEYSIFYIAIESQKNKNIW
jgi:hypothetical protein